MSARNITAYICTSPRPLDNGPCSDSLFNLVRQLHHLLPNVKIIISADGRAPSITDESWNRYLEKLKLIRSRGGARVHQQRKWKHQANSLKGAMTSCKTDYVFVCQDDLRLLIEPRDVRNILAALTQKSVDHVRLSWWHESPGSGRSHWADAPGKAHSHVNHLFSTHFWSDRPHFATTKHYREFVWPRIPADAKKTMEEVIGTHDIDNMCWVYHTGRIGEEHNECGSISSHNIRYTPKTNSKLHPRTWLWLGLVLGMSICVCVAAIWLGLREHERSTWDAGHVPGVAMR